MRGRARNQLTAALHARFHGTRERSRIQALVDAIVPALSGIDPTLDPAVQLSQAVEANVRYTMSQLLESPEGQARLAEGRMKLVGGIYEIATGRVRFLD